MGKLAFRAALMLPFAVLASCGGGGSGGDSLGLPSGQAPSSQAASKPAALQALDANAQQQDPSAAQGLSAAQADSLGGIAGLGAQGADALSERARRTTGPGSVSARFVPGGDPDRYLGSQSTANGDRPERYLLVASGPNAFDTQIIFKPITQSEQAAGGAMVRLNDIALTGNSATQNINGNASFALGRWVTGTVTRGSGNNEVLTGDYTRTYHYLAFNEVPNIPRDGTPPLTCDSGVFTTPTYLDSGTGDTPISGTATGSATISFSDSGASINGSIRVTAGNGAGTVPLGSSFPLNAPYAWQSIFSTNNTTGPWSVSFMLGDGDSNRTMMIAVKYIAVMLPSRARYIGVAKLSCASQP